MKRVILFSGIAISLVACGGTPPIVEPDITVTIDINGNTGAAIDQGFFGIASIVDQPFTINEDRDGDGNLDRVEDVDFDGNLDVAEDTNNNGILDPGEDIDLDGRLDVAEDLDGDGALDFNNEDTNNNGILETNLAIDINQDGVVDINDHTTQSFLIVITSSGEVTCDDLVASLVDGSQPVFNGTLFGTVGVQISLGSGIQSAFRDGQTVTTNTQNQTNAVFINPVYGVFTDGVPSVDSDANGDQQVSSIAIGTIGDTLTATISGEIENQNVVFPYSASVTALPQCNELSAALQPLLESGQLFN